MADRVTIQDIADALGVSRNTVSKAINNTGVLADATREKILLKAAEMGYKQFSYLLPNAMNTQSLSPAEQMAIPGMTEDVKKEIAVITGSFLDTPHFSVTMLDKFQHEISLLGYSMSIHRVTEQNWINMSLPISLDLTRIAGILCVELFNFDYCKMVCDLGIPILLLDSPANPFGQTLNADILLMNNSKPIFQLISNMKKRGITRIGFVGDPHHCRSFGERFLSLHNALFINGLEFRRDYMLTEQRPTFDTYIEYLQRSLLSMDVMPELLICTNDFSALDVIYTLREAGLRCPEDIKVFGFDDSPNAKFSSPSLSTVHIHSQIMGYSATQLLISRIHQPNLNYRTVYAETDLIYRESTE